MDNNYTQIKQESLNGNISDKLFPYLWEYIEHKCQETNTKNLSVDYASFVNNFMRYINTPVIMTHTKVIMPQQQLLNTLPAIFKYLDTKYNIVQKEEVESCVKKEPTEK
jgi:hypothetical protein